jgi:hypothetical protein
VSGFYLPGLFCLFDWIWIWTWNRDLGFGNGRPASGYLRGGEVEKESSNDLEGISQDNSGMIKQGTARRAFGDPGGTTLT